MDGYGFEERGSRSACRPSPFDSGPAGLRSGRTVRRWLNLVASLESWEPGSRSGTVARGNGVRALSMAQAAHDATRAQRSQPGYRAALIAKKSHGEMLRPIATVNPNDPLCRIGEEIGAVQQRLEATVSDKGAECTSMES